ncbi:nectin-4-like isoform X4 [Engystomops pustulosus]|uniref:nectin-4-like isoform X3 n=1 Tax=Engystomops pustulosus TaxID=76066 RepID=UPI003AFAA291
MSALLRVSLLLQVVSCQVRVNTEDYAWYNSSKILKCQADTGEEIKQITWEWQGGGAKMTFLTYRNDTGSILQKSYENRVKFKGDGNKDGSIEILNVALADEGIFKCVFTTYPTGTIEGEIQLHVLVLPIVTQELKQDVTTPCYNLVAECLASSAKPSAEILWIIYGINYTSEEKTFPNSNGTSNTQSQLYMTSTPGLYGLSIQCLVFQPKIPMEYQKNITVTKNLTNIQFPPQMVEIEVLKNDKEALQLLCKSDGNPRPKYNWKRGTNLDLVNSVAQDWPKRGVSTGRRNKEKSVLLHSSSETLNFTAAPDDGLYICEAENNVGVNRGYIYMHPLKSSSRQRYGLLYSIISVGFFLFLIMSYFIISRNRRSEDHEKIVAPLLQGSERKRRSEDHEKIAAPLLQGSERNQSSENNEDTNMEESERAPET